MDISDFKMLGTCPIEYLMYVIDAQALELLAPYSPLSDTRGKGLERPNEERGEEGMAWLSHVALVGPCRYQLPTH